MIDAVLALEEPYRSVILLRFYEDLPPREIARRLEIPVETARTRLKRALAHLRARLDAEHEGDRQAWTLALAPLAALPTTPAGAASGLSAAFSGVIAMCTNASLVVVAAAVVAAAIALFSLWPDEVADRLEPGLTPVEGLAADSELQAEDLRANFETVPVEPRARAGGGRKQGEEKHFAGRFVDEAGRPVAGVSVYGEDPNPRVKTPVLLGVSEPDGRFRVAVTLEASEKQRLFSLSARRKWYATRRWEAVARTGEIVHLGDIVMEPGGAVSGRIVDSTGQPLAGAEVCCTGTTGDSRVATDLHTDRLDLQIRSGMFAKRPQLPQDIIGDKAVSDENGSFRVDGLPLGEARVFAGSANAFVNWSDPVDVRQAEATPGVDLVLELISDANRVAGTVLTPDGEPCVHAEVTVLYQADRARRTSSGLLVGGDGRFSYATNYRGSLSLIAEDTTGHFGEVRLDGVTPGRLDVVLKLVPRAAVFLRVLGDQGKPIEEFSVQLYSGTADAEEDVPRFLQSMSPVGPASRFEKSDLTEEGLAEIRIPGETVRIEVSAGGYMAATVGPYSSDSYPGTIEVVLAREPEVEGMVISADGPVGGVKVSLHRAVPSGKQYMVDDFACRSDPDPVATAKSDVDGKFRLVLSVFCENWTSGFMPMDRGALFPEWGETSGDYFIRAEAEGFAPVDLGPIEVDGTSGRSGLELVLGRGGAIEGKVRVRPDESPGGIVVAVSRGDGFPQTRRTDSDGRYRFECLTRGNWQVEQRDVELSGTSRMGDVPPDEPIVPLKWSCTVKEGETTEYDLDGTRETKGTLFGTILLGSISMAGYVVDIAPSYDPQPPIPAVKVGDDGCFVIENLKPATYVLVIGPPLGSGPAINVSAQIRIEAGANTWSFAPPVGRLEVRGVPPAEGQVTTLSYGWRGADFKGAYLEFRPDAEGVAVLPEAPAGKGKLVLITKGDEDEEGSRKILGDVDIPAGGTAVVDLDQE